MNDLITTFLANSLFIWGVHVLFKEGMVFGKVGIWMQKELPVWVYKPLVGCPPCMGFWYGAAGSTLVCDNIFQCFVYCICMIGFNWLISDIKSYFDATG